MKSLRISLQILALFAIGACSKKPAVSSVSGDVTLDGAPIETGYIKFLPQPNGSAAPVGGVIANGKYSVEVPRGKFLATINAVRVTGKMINEYSKPRPEFASIIPDKYKGGITVEVTTDYARVDFELTSHK
jgi:hypothetical protein